MSAITEAPPTIREAVAVFDDATAMEAAYSELLQNGFDHSHVSLLASETAVQEKLGHRYSRVAQVEDDPKVPRTAVAFSQGQLYGSITGGLIFVGAIAAAIPVFAFGGLFATAIIAAAAAGTGGAAIGGILSGFLAKHHADFVNEQISRGGLVLWVRTMTTASEAKAIGILERTGGRDVHIHEQYAHRAAA